MTVTTATETATAPHLTIVTDEEGTPELHCPHCLVTGVSIVEVDHAVRWNTAEPEIVMEKGRMALVLNFNTGDGDFEHDHYQCGSCDKSISPPEGVALHEDWS